MVTWSLSKGLDSLVSLQLPASKVLHDSAKLSAGSINGRGWDVYSPCSRKDMYTVCFVLPAHLHVNSHGLQKFRALFCYSSCFGFGTVACFLNVRQSLLRWIYIIICLVNCISPCMALCWDYQCSWCVFSVVWTQWIDGNKLSSVRALHGKIVRGKNQKMKTHPRG